MKLISSNGYWVGVAVGSAIVAVSGFPVGIGLVWLTGFAIACLQPEDEAK